MGEVSLACRTKGIRGRRWTRSNWAFLNEPPVIEAEVPRYHYAAQHHVARLATTTKPDTRIAGT